MTDRIFFYTDNNFLPNDLMNSYTMNRMEKIGSVEQQSFILKYVHVITQFR